MVVDDGGLGEELGRVHDAAGGRAGCELVLLVGLFLPLVLATIGGIQVGHDLKVVGEGEGVGWGGATRKCCEDRVRVRGRTTGYGGTVEAGGCSEADCSAPGGGGGNLEI